MQSMHPPTDLQRREGERGERRDRNRGRGERGSETESGERQGETGEQEEGGTESHTETGARGEPAHANTLYACMMDRQEPAEGSNMIILRNII